MIVCCMLQPLLDIVIYAAKLTGVIGAQVSILLCIFCLCFSSKLCWYTLLLYALLYLHKFHVCYL